MEFNSIDVAIIANICTDLTKINSQGIKTTCYSIEQVEECFKLYKNGGDIQDYYSSLKSLISENGSCERNGKMICPTKEQAVLTKLLREANRIYNSKNFKPAKFIKVAEENCGSEKF